MRRMTYESMLDESPEGAIKKLLIDDLGITIKSFTALTEYRTEERMGRKDTIDCFYAEAMSAEFRIRDIEIWEAEWFPIDAPPFPLGMSARTILGMYQQRNDRP